MKNEEYITLEKEASDEFTEKRSRFIGYAAPIKSEEEALAFIAKIKSLHWDAKHNVYAYCLRENSVARYTDDGEPSGTAGIPVLNVLQKSGITDCAVVVTRYFGGILLGGGGLVRAYTHAASLGVNAAGIIVMKPCRVCRLRYDYSEYGRVTAVISEHGGVITDSQFSEIVETAATIPDGEFEAFETDLTDATGGRVKADVVGEGYIRTERSL